MAQSYPVNSKRLDPYRNFEFRLIGTASHKSPGRTKYEGIRLERDIT